MKNKQARNREMRTKSNMTEATVSVRMQIPRVYYDRMREMMNSRKCRKEDILMAGIEACDTR